MVIPFKKQEQSIKKQMQKRKKLLRSFVKIHGNPVIVHAIHNKQVFHEILREGKLKLPKTHNSPQKTPHMEKFLGIDNCIYYSLGFVYFSSYKWKYNLLFDIKFLKELTYYNNSINFQAARAVVDYWYEHDRNYLEELANINTITREVIDRYYYEPYNGKVRKILEFWKIEKELSKYILKYPNKNKLIALIKRTGRKHQLRYPASEKDALARYLETKAPEMIGKKENDLLKNHYFLGFYIAGEMDAKTCAILKKNYSDKIIFDGKKNRKICDL
ncbi:MAG: hypothetical protein AABW75_02840 [Nanoarchaeota archaeon]